MYELIFGLECNGECEPYQMLVAFDNGEECDEFVEDMIECQSYELDDYANEVFGNTNYTVTLEEKTRL